MAKAKETEVVEANTNSEVASDAVIVPDPEELVEITVMSDPGSIGQMIFCSVNGTGMYVPCGEPVKIKRKYAEVLKRSQKEAAQAARKSVALSSAAEKM